VNLLRSLARLLKLVAQPGNEDNQDFLLAEYHEAATSYANGVDIGFNTTKTFFAVNGILITLQQTPEELVNNSQIVGYFQTVAPFFGLLTSVILGLFVSLYFKHLDNCRDRCSEIEKIYGGKLFSRNAKVAGPIVNTNNILFIFALFTFCGWAYFLYKAFY